MATNNDDSIDIIVTGLVQQNNELLHENHELTDLNHDLLEQNQDLVEENKGLIQQNEQLIKQNKVIFKLAGPVALTLKSAWFGIKWFLGMV